MQRIHVQEQFIVLTINSGMIDRYKVALIGLLQHSHMYNCVLKQCCHGQKQIRLTTIKVVAKQITDATF